jgi:hypothetical protein
MRLRWVCAVEVGVTSVAAPENPAVALKMVNQFVALQCFGVPASTRKRKQFDQVGIGGRRVWIRDGEGPSLLQMHLSNVFERAGDHKARVGEVEALSGDTRKVEHLGNNHSIIAAREKVGYVVAQHLFQDNREAQSLERPSVGVHTRINAPL